MSDPAIEAAQRALDQRPWFGYGEEEQLALIAAREALKPIQPLVAKARAWKPYDSRDIGSAHLADTVEDLLDELSKLIYPEGGRR